MTSQLTRKHIIAFAALCVLIVASSSLAAPVQWPIADGGNGHFYDVILAGTPISWDDARSAAQALGFNWDLVTITSSAENDFVKDLFADTPSFFNEFAFPGVSNRSGPWIGAFNVLGPTNFQWVTGESVTFTDWGPSEPFGNGQTVSYTDFSSPFGDGIGIAWNDIGPELRLDGPIAYIVETSSNFNLLYTPVTPCRVVDTRKAGGAIPPGGIRDYNVRGAVASQGGEPAGCPSPKGEPRAVHVNVTAVPLGNGNIVAYPFASTAPSASLVNYRTDAQNVANSGTIKTCFNCSKDISIKSNFGTAHVVIDVLGYYYTEDEIEIVSSYLQYRSYNEPFPWPSDSRYRGYINFSKNGGLIKESDITDIVLKDQNQNEVIIDHLAFDKDIYYWGAWDEVNLKVNFSGPYSYSGFGIHFPAGTNFASGFYTYEAITRFGRKLTVTHYFPGKLELPIVNSATMVSEWIGGDLKLTWTNPDPNGPHDQVRVWIFYEEDGLKLPLMIRLPKTAEEVTIPEQWVDNVKLLSGTNAMDWMVLFYAHDFTATANMYARSFSDTKNIQGWNN